jgi:hypothetical protein
MGPRLATGDKIGINGEEGLTNISPVLTIEAGSTTADLFPATGYFIISAKVAD